MTLLRSQKISAIADVRSSPFSRRTPYFNGNEMKEALRDIDVVYSFLGNELGGRPKKEIYYSNGVADYEKMAQAPAFKEGLKRVLDGTKKYRIALLCSEHNPLDCHRCLLVGRQLARQQIKVEHILSNGSLQSQDIIEELLLDLAGDPSEDLFSSREERLASAYRKRSQRVAFAPARSKTKSTIAAE